MNHQERESFKECAKERELIVLLKQEERLSRKGSETRLGMQPSQRNRDRPGYSN